MAVLKTGYPQSFSESCHQQYPFWHKVHRGCKSHRELQKRPAAHSSSSHPWNTNMHADRLTTKSSAPSVLKRWLVPTPGRWQPAHDQPPSAQQQDGAEAPPPVPVTTAAHIIHILGTSMWKFRGWFSKAFIYTDLH